MAKEETSMTVSTLMTLYPNSLSSNIDGQLIILEGFYSNKNGKLYSKYYYDELVDKNKRNKITIQITQELKSLLDSNSYYDLQGYISKGQNLDNDSRLKVFFRVTKVLKHQEKVQSISKVEYDIIRARFDRDFPIIQDILLKKIERKEKPVLDIITGVQSTSKDDYSNQLSNKDYYNIRHHKCNLSTKKGIIDFLNTYDFKDSDLLIILRGGGSGLEVFDDVELCRKAIELPIPFITGIGHYEDKTLLEKVSDSGFATPTSVGVYLQSIVNSYKERFKAIEKVENEKEILTNQITKQKKNLNIALVVVGLFILITVFFTYNQIFTK